MPFVLGCSTALVVASATLVDAAVPAGQVKKESAAQAEKKALPDMPLAGLPKVWLQGTPVTEWEKDKLYIFEFWATWCGPCIKAMPHMEELHQAFKDKPGVQIIGVNVMDHGQTPDDLKKFLAKRDPKLNYTIAADLDGKTTNVHWLKPQEVKGIPEAFAIKNGKLIWRGHPSALSEKLILAMCKPDFDSEAFKKSAPDPRRDKERYLQELKKLRPMVKEKGWQAAVGHIGALEKEGTVKGDYSVNLYLELYGTLLQLKKADEADKLLRELIRTYSGNYKMQYSLAQRMVAMVHSDVKLTELVLNQALQAAEKNPFKLSPIWALKANLYERLGDVPQALKATQNAIATTNLGEMTATLLKNSGDRETLMDVVNRVAAGIKPEPSYKPLPMENIVEDKIFTPMFEKLTWLNHPGLKGLPKDKAVFIAVWRAYTNGEQLSGNDNGPGRALNLVLKKHGLLNHPEVRSVILSMYPVKKATLEALGGKLPGTPYPVGVTVDNSLLKFAMDMKLDSFPAAVLVRNGEVIWSGEIRRIPAWAVQEAKGGLPGAYAERKVAREAGAEKMKALIKKSVELQRAQKADEYYKLLQDGLKDFGNQAGYACMVAERLSGKYFVEKDYANAVRVLDETLARFPLEDSAASYIMKIYTCSDGMREHSYHARRRALQIMRDGNTRGSDIYNSACYEEMCRMAMERKDYAQAKKDAEKALADMTLVKKLAELKRK